MPESGRVISRLRVRLRALLHRDWFGRAGECFRTTTATMSEYAREHLRLEERAKEAPDLLWKAAEGTAHDSNDTASPHGGAVSAHTSKQKRGTEYTVTLVAACLL